MGCESIPQSGQLKIIRGEDRIIALRLFDENSLPYDLTGMTEITAKFKKEDGTFLSKTYTDVAAPITITSLIGGKFNVKLADTETALLKAGLNQDFEVIIDKGTEKRIVAFKKLLTVEKALS